MNGAFQNMYEIAVVERPGADTLAVRAWSELVGEANRMATRLGLDCPRLLVTRWSVEPDSEPVRRLAFDGLRPSAPRIIALPDEMGAQAWCDHGGGAFSHWLRSHYEVGTTLAASNAAASLLERYGLCEPSIVRPATRERDGVCVEDSGGLLTAHGARAWLFIGLGIIGRVHGTRVMHALACKMELRPITLILAGLYHFAPDFSHGDSSIMRAQRWLHENQAIGVDLKGLCRISGLHPRTLQRRFFSATGSRPIQYMQQVRVSHAQRLILRGVRVADVAVRVGYADPSAFRRIFMRISGCAPTAYLKHVKRGEPGLVPMEAGLDARPGRQHASG